MQRIMNKLAFFFVVIVSLLACNSDSKIESKIAEINVDLEVTRFDLEFAKTTPESLQAIKGKYPALFAQQYHDSIWLNTLRDTLQIALNNEVAKNFASFDAQEIQLELLFKHFKYYFPEFETPTAYTVVSYVDYQNRVLARENDLIIALDTYLGSNHPFYQDIPVYIAQNLNPEQLVQDVADLYARRFVPPPADRTFLAQMVYYGKLLYLKDMLLPDSDEHERIGYSQEHYNWAQENEQDIWRYFIEKEALFKTDPKLLTQFIKPAPFSKFYLEIDNESPGRIGRFIGWQMVRQFMEKNNIPLRTMLTTPAANIYKQSNYKPNK